jgi:hypothetical protein
VAYVKWLTDWLAVAWLLAALVVVFLAPFVVAAVLINYVWGMV